MGLHQITFEDALAELDIAKDEQVHTRAPARLREPQEGEGGATVSASRWRSIGDCQDCRLERRDKVCPLVRVGGVKAGYRGSSGWQRRLELCDEE